MAKDVKDMLKELEVLAKEVSTTQKSKRKKSTKKESPSLNEKQLKEELNKVKDIKKSLDVLEKEVFIKIDNPDKIVNDLVEGKRVVKEITTGLMALTKINKLKEEIIEKLERDIQYLRSLSSEMENALNLDEYSKTLPEGSTLNTDIIEEYIDTIEDDIEEIRRYMGVAK